MSAWYNCALSTLFIKFPAVGRVVYEQYAGRVSTEVFIQEVLQIVGSENLVVKTELSATVWDQR